MTKNDDGEILKSMVGELFEQLEWRSDQKHEYLRKLKTVSILTAVEVKDLTYELGSGGALEYYECTFIKDLGNENTKLQKEVFNNLNEFQRKYRKIDARDRVRAKFQTKDENNNG